VIDRLSRGIMSLMIDGTDVACFQVNDSDQSAQTDCVFWRYSSPHRSHRYLRLSH